MKISCITQGNDKIFKSFSCIQANLRSSHEVIIENQLEIGQNSNNFALVILSSQNIFLKYSQASYQIAHLNFSIKFQLILQNQQNIKSRKIGFRLIKDNSQDSISFFSSNAQLLDQWIKTLRALINQVGFHNNFKPIRKLGRGQFATVFQVQNLQTCHKYAVKAFSKSHLTKSQKGIQSLINQIKIMRSLKHKNLQQLECVYQSDNSIYVVTQLLRGGTLFDRLQQLSLKNKSMTQQQIRQIMQGLLNGLDQLNQLKIVHRDLKLDNIMLRHMNSFQPVVIDFGLAAFSDDPEYLYYRCGTPGYVSPQVMNSSKTQKTQPISDIFSLGAIFYHLLTKKPLFQGKSPEQILKNNKNFNYELSSSRFQQVNEQAWSLLQKMLEIDPKDRINANQAIIHDFFFNDSKLGSPASTTYCQNERYTINFSQI